MAWLARSAARLGHESVSARGTRKNDSILRHANVSTTPTYYIKTAAADAQAAMAKLETELIGQQTGNDGGDSFRTSEYRNHP